MDQTQNDDDRVGTIQRLWSEGDYRRIGELFAQVQSGVELRDQLLADRLQEMLAGLPATLELERRQHGFLFPSTAAALTLLEEASGPVQRLRDGVAQVGGDGADLCSAIRQRWDQEADIVDDGVLLTSTYAVARIAVAG